MFGFEFANPEYFWLLVLLVPMILWYVLREKKSYADLQFSSLRAFKGMRHTGKIWMRHLLFVLQVLAIFFLVVALARPQSSNNWQTYTSEGIDIVLALDISGSMLARDFTPDRLEAAKEVATKFILERPQDKINEGGTKRDDRGWYGYWFGFGECGKSSERQSGEIEGCDFIDRRSKQPGGYCSPDRSGVGESIWHSGVYDWSGDLRGSSLSGTNAVWCGVA